MGDGEVIDIVDGALNAADLPGAVYEEGCLAAREELEGLGILCGQGVLGEEAFFIEVLDVIKTGNPGLAVFVVRASRYRGMRLCILMVVDGVFKPIMRNFL